MRLELKINRKETKKVFFWIIMLIPFVPIQYLNTTFPFIKSVYAYGRMAVIFLMTYMIAVVLKRISIPIIMSILIIIAAFISSYLRGVDLYSVFGYSLYLLGFTMVVDCGISKDRTEFLKSMLVYYGAMIVLNYLFTLKFPNGYVYDYGDMYMFGNHNTTVRKLMPGLYAGLLYSFYRHRRLRWWFYLLYFLLILFCIHVWSATSIGGMIVLGAAIFYFTITNKQGIFQYKYFFVGSVVITMIFAVLQNFQQFKAVEFIITNILNKDPTLSTRTIVWSNTIKLIAESPILGYGQADTEVNRKLLGAASAHNVFLDELYFGGIVGLVLLFAVVIIVGKAIQREKDRKLNVVIVITEAIFCSYFIMWNFEPFADLNSFYVIYGMFTMAYYCGKFCELGISYKYPFKRRA